MPRKDGTGPYGNGPKKVNQGVPDRKGRGRPSKRGSKNRGSK